MIQSLHSDTARTAPIQPARRESDAQKFNAALELQTTTLLGAILDPTATASLPGAGAALAQAEAAGEDVSQLASDRLLRQESRQGARERGLDAASQARQELAQQGTNAQASAPATSVEGAPANRSVRGGDAETQIEPDAAPETPEQHAQKPLLSADRSATPATTTAQAAPMAQGAQHSAAAHNASVVVQAGSGSKPVGETPAAVSSATGVGQVASGAAPRATPTVFAGTGAASQKPQTESQGRSVIRHEPRAFEAQLQRGLAQVLRQQGGTLSMKLDPVELGTVKVSLTMTHGRVDGTIEASNEQARGLLEEHLETLKSSLERRGITVDRLDVRLAGATESERQFFAGQDAGRGLDQHGAGAGSDRHSGSFRGEDRHAGDRGGHPGEPAQDWSRGAGPTADEWHGQGRPAEPLGGWLRLDTLA